MALKQIEIQSQIKIVNHNLNKFNKELEVVESRSKEVGDKFMKAQDQGNIEKMKELLEEQNNLTQKSNDLKEEIERSNKLLKLLEDSFKETGKGITVESNNNNIVEDNKVFRERFNDFVRSKGRITRDEGFTSDKAEILLPEDISYRPSKRINTKQQLINYVTVIPVTHREGSWPIQNINEGMMYTTDELKESPELQYSTFDEVGYKIETRRGHLVVPEEVIDDAEIDIYGHLEEIILEQRDNTNNAIILEQFRNFPFRDFSTLDDIKDIRNADLDPAYELIFFMSQSLFNAIDKLKDNNNNYLIQSDVTKVSDKALFGIPIIVIKDTIIGKKKGDMVGFLGDSKRGIYYFLRKQMTLGYENVPIYGKQLESVLRSDCVAVDQKAGYYLVYKEPTDKEKQTLATKGQIVISNG